MTAIRVLFCDAAEATTPLVADPALKERFEGPSALAEFSVRGLAGHLLRAMTSVDGYLDRPPPDDVIAPGEAAEAPGVSAAEYYAAVLADRTDIESDFHRSIRQRGVEAAPADPEEYPGAWRETAARLRARLAAEPAGRLVRVFGDLVLTLDQYVLTRLIELVIHVDDLAASLGVQAPPLPAEATGAVITTLVEVARIRHGGPAVVRALTRRERDGVDALRVL